MEISFGIRLPVSGPLASEINIIRIGEAADELGFDAITTHDHVTHLLGQRYHNSGGLAESVDERVKSELPVTMMYETIVSLSVLAGLTKKVKLIPCAAVLPWRHPVLFSKQIITLQELSGGRFVCCVAIGKFESDFMVMGVSYAKRGIIMKEYLELLRLILSPGAKAIKFEGEFVNIPEMEFYPKPSIEVPIWIAGFLNSRAYTRVAKFGQGFVSMGDPAAYKRALPNLEQHLKDEKKKLSDITIGNQVFTCIMSERNRARRQLSYTIERFFEGKEFSEADPAHPGKTFRDTAIEEAHNGAIVGNADDAIKKIRRVLRSRGAIFRHEIKPRNYGRLSSDDEIIIK